VTIELECQIVHLFHVPDCGRHVLHQHLTALLKFAGDASTTCRSSATSRLSGTTATTLLVMLAFSASLAGQ
jgi:hypothetical protein